VLDVNLPGDGPFDRAWLLISLVESTFCVDDWRGVCRRAQAIDGRQIAAIRRLTEARSATPSWRSRSRHS
jgi:hypothetical protein